MRDVRDVTTILQAADNDKMDVVCTPGRIANVEAAWGLCEGCYRPDVVGERCELILLKRILFRALYDNSESGVFPEAVGIEMRFYVFLDVVNSSLGCSSAGEEVEQGDDLRFIEVFDIVEIEIPGT